MTKGGLIKTIATTMGISQTEAKRFLSAYIEIATATIQQGDTLSIPGFGLLKPVIKKQRKGYNIITGRQMVVPESTTVHFVPGKFLLRAANKNRGD